MKEHATHYSSLVHGAVKTSNKMWQKPIKKENLPYQVSAHDPEYSMK